MQFGSQETHDLERETNKSTCYISINKKHHRVCFLKWKEENATQSRTVGKSFQEDNDKHKRHIKIETRKGRYKGKAYTFFISVQRKAQFFLIMYFFPMSFFYYYTHTKHLTFNTSDHKMCEGFSSHQSVLCDTSCMS